MNKSGLTNNNVAVIFSSSCAPEKFADTNLNFILPKSDFRSTNNPAPPLPLIVNFAGHISGGLVSDAKLSPADLAPTLAEIAYAKTPTNFTGLSILPILKGKPRMNTPAVPDKQEKSFEKPTGE
jgi:hypothetical protein